MTTITASTPSIYISYSKLESLVKTVCDKIETSGWQPSMIVGVTRGGLLPAVILSHHFNVPCKTLDVSFRDNPNAVVPVELIRVLENHQVLVVDDINDSGTTINSISQYMPIGTRYAVLIDNQASQCTIKVDYCGANIDKSKDDVWIVFPYEQLNGQTPTKSNPTCNMLVHTTSV